MSAWEKAVDKQVRQLQQRRDPLARLPWVVWAVFCGLLALIGVAQLLHGGLNALLGLLLLGAILPSQVLQTVAARRVQQRGAD